MKPKAGSLAERPQAVPLGAALLRLKRQSAPVTNAPISAPLDHDTVTLAMIQALVLAHLGMMPAQFYRWAARYGQLNTHNGQIPRVVLQPKPHFEVA